MKLTKTTLNESSKKVIIHFYLEGERGDGEQQNVVLFDAKTDLNPNEREMRPSITQIWSSNSWFDLLLKFDDLQAQPSWVITRDTNNYHDFRYFGGLKDRAGLDGGSGKILMTTNGFEAGSIGTFILELKKD